MKSNQILLVKEEATAGTAEAMTGADVVLTTGISNTVYDGDTTSLEVDGVNPQNVPVINTSPHQTLSFPVPFAGSGAAGTAPAYKALMKACGFTETIAAGTSVTYKLSNSVSKTVSLARYVGDEMLQQAAGCRGAVKLSMGGGNLPELSFDNFKGSYLRPSTANFPASLTYANLEDPVPFTKSNTTTLTIDGYSPPCSAFSIDFGSSVKWRNIPNLEGSNHGLAKPSGQVTILAPSLAEKNYWSKLESHNSISVVSINLVHGTIAGNIITISSAKVQISNISESTEDGEIAYSMDLLFLEAPTIVLS